MGFSNASRRTPQGGRLTQRDFPLGETVYRYAQSRLLEAAVSGLRSSHDEASVGFWRAATNDDPGEVERNLNRRLGSTVPEA